MGKEEEVSSGRRSAIEREDAREGASLCKGLSPCFLSPLFATRAKRVRVRSLQSKKNSPGERRRGSSGRGRRSRGERASNGTHARQRRTSSAAAAAAAAAAKADYRRSRRGDAHRGRGQLRRCAAEHRCFARVRKREKEEKNSPSSSRSLDTTSSLRRGWARG